MAAAASAEQQQGILWDGVIELTKAAQERGTEPLIWAIQLSSSLNAAGVVLPSPELAKLLVSHVCWSNNVPVAWKFLEKALTMKIVPPILVLALLSASVIPSRRFYPAAYRIYLELLKRHAFSFASQINSPNYKKIMKSINEVLHISQIFALPSSEPGLLMVGFVFSIVWHLLDASLDDEGLLELTPEKKSRWPTGTLDMEIDSHGSIDEKRTERHEAMLKVNTIMAVEIIGELFKNKVTSKILCLARRNLSLHWGCFIQHLRLLAANSSALRNSKNISPEALLRLTSDMRNVLSRECKTSLQKRFHSIIASGSLTPPGQVHVTSRSALWLPFDLFLEDSMDGSQVNATSAVEVLTGLLKSLQAVNQATWQDAFLGLWIAALRVVQREREPGDGPIPRLDTCMCLLLSVTTLAILNTIEEEETALKNGAEYTSTYQMKEKLVPGKCRRDLVASLQQLGDYEALLAPPLSITSIVNQAAAKAMLFLSGITVGSGCLDGISLNDMPVNCSGNLRHLIVEACIARNLLDTSAYFWPGYVKGHSNQIPRSISGQMLGWSSLMKGSPLTPPLVNTLVSTPASRYNATSFSGFGPFSHHSSSGASVIIWNGDNWLCINYLFTATLSFHRGGFPATSGSAGPALRKFMNLAEIEKIYEIAVSGSDDEKISAATILCGASLVRGWNIQEHTVLLITRLLSPPVPADCSGSESHLIGFAPFLNVVLVGISSVDCVHIFSLHGMVSQLAGAVMPICEVFGSRAPMVSWTLTTGEKISSHAVFSNAFTLLLKLWRFDRPPLEHVMGDVTPVGSQMTPEYLLMVRNNELASYAKIPRDQYKIKRLSKFSSPASTEPIFMDSFPRLKCWYRQNQECIASTLSGLVNGSPVHQIVDGLLNMMFRKVNRGGQPTTSGSSNSSGSALEDNSLQLKLPAWDILEAVPFVLDAALTACAHGRLSPRELATGLKDLADFLPASLATIISYFSAEVTRGIWKAVPMNGTDWPSPAANLAAVEQQIKKILAGTGVDVPTIAAAGGTSPGTLPLPLAALVSFTITYKLDRAAESLLYLIGPALITLAAGCPWPCLPIIASLWAQKVKRWNDFLMFCASRSVFHHNSDAVDQLLRICFRSTLGLSSSPISSNGGVGALLGHGFRSHLSGRISPVAPGILYLRVHRSVRNVMFMTEVIVVLLLHSVKDIASCSGVHTEKMDKLKKTKHGMRYGQLSLAAAMTRVKAAASLGASLVWITGGINLVQSLIKETLPSWFLSDHKSELDAGESGGAVAMLRGYALAYFAVISGTFAWGVDSSSPASIRRHNILGSHLEFLASALDGKISLGCDHATWRAYVSGFVSLMIGCTPLWMQEMGVGVLKRVSNGLRQWNEDELALALLGISGARAMGAAAEMIMDGEF